MPLPGSSDAIDLAGLLPEEVHGWKAELPDGRYDYDTLFDYIDGGAEVYRSFNVRSVLGRRYEKPGAQPILADVFDMGSAKDAFGAYNHDLREGPSADIGQESELLGGNLTFWKGRFYVAIIPFGQGQEARKAVLEIGRAAGEAIAEEGPRPDLLQFLPESDRAKQAHYFHNHFCLNAYYFLSKENLLALGQDTEGVLARYIEKEPQKENAPPPPSILLLIRYPSAEKAQEAFAQFRQAYLPDADEGGMAQTENSRWAGSRRMESLLAAVFDAPTKEKAQALLGSIGDPEKKNQGGMER